MATKSSKKPPWARIVVVDYCSGPHLKTCIEALAAQSFADFEVVIVDNDCPEGAARKLDLPDAKFRLLKANENLGYAGGSNLGASGANSPWVIMLNPDATPDRNWLASLKQATEAYSDVVMFGTTLVQAQNTSRLDGYGDVLSIFGIAWRGGTNMLVEDAPNQDLYVFGPCGAAALYRRDVFESMGGFKESFFCYMEDVDLAWRIGRHGGKCIQVHNALASHVAGASTMDQPEFPLYQSARNSVWMIAGTAPALLVVPMLTLNLFIRIYLLFRGSYGTSQRAVLRGVRDGWAGIGPHFMARHKPSRLFDNVGSKPLNTIPVFSISALREKKIIGTPATKNPSPKSVQT